METIEARLKALMLASLAGQESSYRTLLREVSERLRIYYARRLPAGSPAAEDLVQDTLIAIHTRRATYDRERPFTAWLHAIARYKLIDYLRQQRRQHEVALDETAEEMFAVDETGAMAARLDVERLLLQVPEGPRALIQAVRVEGRSVAEVSATTGLSESVVKVTIHRALKRLSERLNREKPR